VPHDVSLISTIAVGLAFAFAGGFAAVRVGLPPIVGYLLAGVAIGPFTPGFVSDAYLGFVRRHCSAGRLAL
jgi:K+:H+ antiporter